MKEDSVGGVRSEIKSGQIREASASVRSGEALKNELAAINSVLIEDFLANGDYKRSVEDTTTIVLGAMPKDERLSIKFAHVAPAIQEITRQQTDAFGLALVYKGVSDERTKKICERFIKLRLSLTNETSSSENQPEHQYIIAGNISDMVLSGMTTALGSTARIYSELLRRYYAAAGTFPSAEVTLDMREHLKKGPLREWSRMSGTEFADVMDRINPIKVPRNLIDGYSEIPVGCSANFAVIEGSPNSTATNYCIDIFCDMIERVYGMR